MNNLRDIYTNVLDNIYKFYSKVYNNPKGKIYIPSFVSIFDSNKYIQNWNTYKNLIIDSIMLYDVNFAFHIGNISVNNNDLIIKPSQNVIPVYILFSHKNEPVNTYKLINGKKNDKIDNNKIDNNKINFIINILTHKYEGSNTINISSSIRASEYFYRQFTYKEFSIDIFNHVYQPKFQLITDSKVINDITNKYLIDLSSMGSIFLNDPVNKRLFGLPKINIGNNNVMIKKLIPDIYKILQDQGVNYRKVIASNSHNPFTK